MTNIHPKIIKQFTFILKEKSVIEKNIQNFNNL